LITCFERALPSKLTDHGVHDPLPVLNIDCVTSYERHEGLLITKLLHSISNFVVISSKCSRSGVYRYWQIGMQMSLASHPEGGEEVFLVSSPYKIKTTDLVSAGLINHRLCHSHPPRKNKTDTTVCMLPLIIVFLAQIIWTLNNFSDNS